MQLFDRDGLFLRTSEMLECIKNVIQVRHARRDSVLFFKSKEDSNNLLCNFVTRSLTTNLPGLTFCIISPFLQRTKIIKFNDEHKFSHRLFKRFSPEDLVGQKVTSLTGFLQSQNAL